MAATLFRARESARLEVSRAARAPEGEPAIKFRRGAATKEERKRTQISAAEVIEREEFIGLPEKAS
jgi:hypothetical protein